MNLTPLALALLLTGPSLRAEPERVPSCVEASSQHTPDELLRFADMALEELDSYVAQLESMQAWAVRENPRSEPRCLLIKQASIHTLLLAMERAAQGCEQALLEGDLGLAAWEHRKIVIALIRARRLREEADACSGGYPADHFGPIHVLETPIREPDETDPIELPDEFGDAPPATSPFQ